MSSPPSSSSGISNSSQTPARVTVIAPVERLEFTVDGRRPIGDRESKDSREGGLLGPGDDGERAGGDGGGLDNTVVLGDPPSGRTSSPSPLPPSSLRTQSALPSHSNDPWRVDSSCSSLSSESTLGSAKRTSVLISSCVMPSSMERRTPST